MHYKLSFCYLWFSERTYIDFFIVQNISFEMMYIDHYY